MSKTNPFGSPSRRSVLKYSAAALATGAVGLSAPACARRIGR